MSLGEYQLKCRVRQGMFPDEYLVIVEAIDEKGQRVQMVAFADKEELEVASFPKGSEDVEGLLSVSTLEIKDRLASVVLPKPTFSNGPVVSIDASDLIPVGG